MSAAVHRDSVVGFEEGMLSLPSHDHDSEVGFQEGMILNPNTPSNVYVRNRHQNQQHQGHRRLPREPWPQYSKSSARSSSYHQRPKHATGGPGMQAIFLCSGQGTCGTGVFLPQRAGTKPTQKPACAPVLLPARVVQALNLKVHALGLQISPPQVPKCNARREEVCTNESTKKKNDLKDGFNVRSSSSPDIFLPKEWTY